ncbi:MAG: MmgE/PrpD family protein [Burkholderiales bacterium]
MTGLTRQLAEFVSGLAFEKLPQTAVETAKRGAIDTVGVMFAGRDEPVAKLAAELAAAGAGGEARVGFDRGFAHSQDAALANGTAGHALDYDDVALEGHPSVVLVPAILAEGERLGASGRDLITAYVAGYETWGELLDRDEDQHHGKGWHPTAVFGTVAAAAAAARLARLDPARTANALGIAASMAGGLVANFGSMTKPFQAGRAAQSGILAARLAGRGMTASPDALEHPSGFLRAFSPAGRVRVDGELAAGRDWHIVRQGLNVKRYPVCYALHRAIDGMLAIRSRVPSERVAEVEVTLGRTQMVPLREHRPRTGLEAKFSAEFAMASALVAGRVGMGELTNEFVNQAAVQALFPKVRVTPVDETDPEDPLFAPADRVRVKLADGSTVEGESVRYALGHARNPIGLDELHAKFRDCVGDALPADAAARLFERLSRLEAQPAAAALYAP